MASFTFKSILHDSNPLIESATFLWIWHADKIPPHIGISTQGHYYSLKVSGKDEKLNVQKVFSNAKYRKIPLILVELKQSLPVELLQDVFSNFDFAEVDKATCLSPLVTILNKNAQQLSDLLFLLENESAINQFHGCNLPEGYSALQEYSSTEIQSRLKLLNEKRRKEHIS